MLFKDDVTITIQKWGSRPRHAGLKMGLVSEERFSSRIFQAAFDSKKRDQARLLHFCVMDEVDAYRGRNNDRLIAKRIYIQ